MQTKHSVLNYHIASDAGLLSGYTGIILQPLYNFFNESTDAL